MLFLTSRSGAQAKCAKQTSRISENRILLFNRSLTDIVLTDSHINQYLRRNDDDLARTDFAHRTGQVGGIAVHCVREENNLICRRCTFICQCNRERRCNEARYQTLRIIEEDDELSRSVLVLQEEILRARGVIID